MFQNEKIQILYGSQTGNAQDLAERIWRDSKRFYFSTSVKPMDEYNITELIHESCVIFVCSTTGQGEEPNNMKIFWKFLLRKNLPLNSLCKLKFAVFGLGDSSYTKFNFAAKKLHRRLLQLGGQSIINLGLGDDQHDFGYDAAADPWIEELWGELLHLYPLPNGVRPLDKNLPILPRWGVSTFLQPKQIKTNQSMFYTTKSSNDFIATVVDNVRTTASNHFQDVRLIKLQTKGEIYSPGDVLSLRPRNLPWQVNAFKDVLKENGINIENDEMFELNQIDAQIPIPEPLRQHLSFQQLCEEYFDLMAIPRRFTFHLLSQLTDSELEKEKCTEFTSAEGQDDLFTYCNRPKRNIVEVLQDFPHATKNITPKILFELLPPIRPRDFSIASSYKTHKNEIHILVAVIKYKTKLVKERFGLCSNYLADLQCGDEVFASLKRGSFRFPDGNTPVIMVGPGTGVAPFRSYICERASQNLADKNRLLLFFGCRSECRDFHFKDDFLQLKNNGHLTLISAFSRDQDQKVYVQDKIMENERLVWDFMQRNSTIFVAGNAKNMPQEVRNAFLKVCENVGEMSAGEAEIFIRKMEKNNKYQTECWS